MNDFKNIKVLIYQCPECDQWIYSRAQHDMKYCSCKNSALDGGHDERGVWVPERLIGSIIEAKTKVVVLNTNDLELYTDWNESINNYGVYNG